MARQTLMLQEKLSLLPPSWGSLEQEILALTATRSPRTKQRLQTILKECETEILFARHAKIQSAAVLITPLLAQGGIFQSFCDCVWDVKCCPWPQLDLPLVASCTASGKIYLSVHGPKSKVVAEWSTPEGGTSINCIDCHPSNPYVVAGGCGNGAVCVWWPTDRAVNPETPLSPQKMQVDELYDKGVCTVEPSKNMNQRNSTFESMILDDSRSDASSDSRSSGGEEIFTSDEFKGSTEMTLAQKKAVDGSKDTSQARHTEPSAAKKAALTTASSQAADTPCDSTSLIRILGDVVTSVAWSSGSSAPDVVVGSRAGRVLIVETTPGTTNYTEVRIPASCASSAITSIEADPCDDNLFVAATAIGAVLVVDKRVTRCEVFQTNSKRKPCYSCLFANEHMLCTSGGDHKVRLWDLRNIGRTSVASCEFPSSVTSLSGVVPSSDNNGFVWAAATEKDDKVSLLNLKTMQVGGTVKRLHGGKMITASSAMRLGDGTAAVVTSSVVGTVGSCVYEVQ